ncbi:hypothetical protein CEXT_326931, partial [Caerostris extrusa]
NPCDKENSQRGSGVSKKSNCTKSKKPLKMKDVTIANLQRAMERSDSSTRERRAGFESQGTNNVVRSPCIGCNENEVRSVHQHYQQPIKDPNE